MVTFYNFTFLSENNLNDVSFDELANITEGDMEVTTMKKKEINTTQKTLTNTVIYLTLFPPPSTDCINSETQLSLT